jgi:hypothetical protein
VSIRNSSSFAISRLPKTGTNFLGASDQTGWTGVIARSLDLF